MVHLLHLLITGYLFYAGKKWTNPTFNDCWAHFSKLFITHFRALWYEATSGEFNQSFSINMFVLQRWFQVFCPNSEVSLNSNLGRCSWVRIPDIGTLVPPSAKDRVLDRKLQPVMEAQGQFCSSHWTIDQIISLTELLRGSWEFFGSGDVRPSTLSHF